MTTHEGDEDADVDGIEYLVGKAYEIGYCHGGNSGRHARREPPSRADEGWLQYAEKIQALVAAREQRARLEERRAILADVPRGLELDVVDAWRKKWEAAHPLTVAWAAELKASQDAVQSSFVLDPSDGSGKTGS